MTTELIVIGLGVPPARLRSLQTHPSGAPHRTTRFAAGWRVRGKHGSFGNQDTSVYTENNREFIQGDEARGKCVGSAPTACPKMAPHGRGSPTKPRERCWKQSGAGIGKKGQTSGYSYKSPRVAISVTPSLQIYFGSELPPDLPTRSDLSSWPQSAYPLERPPQDLETASWFTKEVQPHEGMLRHYLVGIARPADIDDLVQESYVRLLRMREQNQVRSPRGLLFTMARNAAHDLFRRRGPPASPPSPSRTFSTSSTKSPAPPRSSVGRKKSSCSPMRSRSSPIAVARCSCCGSLKIFRNARSPPGSASPSTRLNLNSQKHCGAARTISPPTARYPRGTTDDRAFL